jgi:hypothetical protein
MEIKDFVCKIEKSNAEFDAMSDAEKRVQIAKDALAALKLKFLVSGSTFGTFREPKTNKPVVPDAGQDLKEYFLANTHLICNVCAKSTLFMSKVLRKNNYNYHFDGPGDEPNREVCNYLSEFSQDQLDLIECAYELDTFSWTNCDRDLAEIAVYAYFGYNQDERLVLILKNIIRNKGEFVIPRRAIREYNSY